ncbi:BRISC complex subunit FAM175B-like [Euwallacea fornicatus]|uniref:BRISC complex subunit FAM175B-like n=1 Tax=Euwallacea fornicatus TaxID=995702 RepID=UPI00338E6F78
MFQPASVSLSGPAFSFLLYETSKDILEQRGFLLGEIVHKETTSITDNEQKQVNVLKIIKINSVIPCPSHNYFPRGKVDKEKLQKFLGSAFSQVVAWYKYEESSTSRLTLKDRALHKQFQEIFDIPQDLFSVCFLTSGCTDTFSTYNYQQNFMRYGNGTFDKLNICIPNLSESNNTYKNSEPASDLFNKILFSLKMDIENTKGVVAVTEIENAVQSYMTKTVKELAKAEQTLFDLEQEIQVLKDNPSQENQEVHNDAQEDTINCNAKGDAIGCEEETIPEKKSPTIEKQPRRTRSKSNSNRSPSVTDSNKRESLRQFDTQKSPESIKKGITKTRAKGKGGKKKF